jgi:hypothetical protein
MSGKKKLEAFSIRKHLSEGIELAIFWVEWITPDRDNAFLK